MNPNNEQVESAIAARNRFMRHDCEARSLAERLAAFEKLQRELFRRLKSNPEGYENFMRRNMKSRRTKLVNGKRIPVSPDRCTPPE